MAHNTPAIQRAVTFLVGRQKADATWEEAPDLAGSAPPWARPGSQLVPANVVVEDAFEVAAARTGGKLFDLSRRLVGQEYPHRPREQGVAARAEKASAAMADEEAWVLRVQDYRAINRRAWGKLAHHGCGWTRPVAPEDLGRARELVDPHGWVDWKRGLEVLCLASGGGQQAVLFAAAGARVTSYDLTPEQLERDRETARRFGLHVETVEGDMCDLSALVQGGRLYDLVYQTVSTDFVPDVNVVYREVAKMLRPGGQYLVTHWNPIFWQLDEEWVGGYRVVRPQKPGEPLVHEYWEIDGKRVTVGTVEFFHPLHDLIGGLCRAGFVIEDFSEDERGDPTAPPGSWDHLRAFFPPLLAIKARRR
ncbi:MAG: class I SAM-dependent methyltransferase [Bacillota bacterium]